MHILLPIDIPESTLLLPCTDTEEASRRMLFTIATTSYLPAQMLGRNLALPENELRGVLYASKGDLKEDRYMVSGMCLGVVNFHTQIEECLSTMVEKQWSRCATS